VAEFKTTFSANFSTFLWETHNELYGKKEEEKDLKFSGMAIGGT